MMSDLVKRLVALGFVPVSVDRPDGDFELQDDGEGPYIKHWLSAAPQPTYGMLVAVALPSELDEVRKAARAAVLRAVDVATSAILDAYPRAERLGWDAKASEAQRVLAVGEAATLELAPLLVAECIGEYGAADEPTRLAQLVAKAATVVAKAAAWGELMATLSGIRGRAFTAIADAENAAAVETALDAAVADIGAATMTP